MMHQFGDVSAHTNRTELSTAKHIRTTAWTHKDNIDGCINLPFSKYPENLLKR
jgi:hypothetical protein